MGVSFGRARIADLAFHVFHRSLHPEWFATRAHHRVARGDWQADVRIIEGGHSVVFGSRSFRLTEVLAGPETVLPEPGLLYHTPIRNERSTTLRPGGLLDFQACFEVERVDPVVFRHLCEEMTADAGYDSIFHQFRSTNRLAPQPISRIHIDARARGISIQAFHTFPDELAVVRSLSLYELLPRSSNS
jgi:Protein of unknown function DUF2617